MTSGLLASAIRADNATLQTTDPDEALLRRIGDGDEVAVRALVARKLPRLLALANRMLRDAAEAEDVAQETFVRVWRHARAWRLGRAKFDTWLFRVALNLCYDRLRKRREAPMSAPSERIDPAANADETLVSAERARRVAEAVAALPPRQRDAIVLQYDRELSNIEAAAVMGLSVEALESLLARARRTLRTQLLEAEDG
jgi:RNA polymerase sigma-70 factor (ECF subfamily)